MREIYTHIKEEDTCVSTVLGEKDEYPSRAAAEAGTKRKLRDVETEVMRNLLGLGFVGLISFLNSQVPSEPGNVGVIAMKYLPQMALGAYLIRDISRNVREIGQISDLLTQLTQRSSDEQSTLLTDE